MKKTEDHNVGIEISAVVLVIHQFVAGIVAVDPAIQRQNRFRRLALQHSANLGNEDILLTQIASHRKGIPQEQDAASR